LRSFEWEESEAEFREKIDYNILQSGAGVGQARKPRRTINTCTDELEMNRFGKVNDALYRFLSSNSKPYTNAVGIVLRIIS